jgi:hypothetical protein
LPNTLTAAGAQRGSGIAVRPDGTVLVSSSQGIFTLPDY